MIFQFISLSAVDKNSAESYMKLLLALTMSYEEDFSPQFRRKLTRWRTESNPFIQRFRLKASPIDRAYKRIIAGYSPETDDPTHAAVGEVFEDMHSKKDQFVKELDLTKEDLKFLNDLRLLGTKNSEAAHRAIGKNVSRFGDSDFNRMFLHAEQDTSSVQSELKALVRKYGGVSGMIMPTEVLEQWQAHNKAKGTKLSQHTKYLALTGELRASFKKFLQTLVRKSGKPYLPVSDVISACTANGVPHNLPEGFVGNIDDNGKFYTVRGLRMLQTPSGDVRMNPKYDPDEDNAYVCQFTPAFAKGPTRAFTEKYRSEAKTQKFETVLEALPHMKGAAKKWRSDMTNIKKKTGVLATLAELIYDTSARVSNENAKTGGETTHGATTLQVGHVNVMDAVIHIKYVGKSAQRQHHVIKLTTPSLKLMARNLKALMVGKRKTDRIFVYNEQGITGTMISRYLKAIGLPAGFTVHMFRTIRATEMAQEMFKKSPFKKNGNWDDTDVHKWVESEILKIGIELGHMNGEKPTANTAIQNYINPEILADFYNKLGIRPSAKIQKAIDSAKKPTK